MNENEVIIKLKLKIDQLEKEIEELKDADKFWDSVNSLNDQDIVNSQDDFMLKIINAEGLIAQNDLLQDIALFAIDNQISLRNTTL